MRLRFDRYLLPSSVVRQSFVVLDGSRQPLPAALVGYDPVTATVTLSNPNLPADAGTIRWLEIGQPYTILLGIPGDDDVGGVRALDRATLESALTIGFTVSNEVLPADQVSEPQVTFCGDVLPVLSAKCGSGSPCHTPFVEGAPPASGLTLTTPDGVQKTAIGRPAQGASTGPRPGIARSQGKIFGIDMPIVDPGNAPNSWLLYKVMMAPYPPASPSPAGGPDSCPAPGAARSTPVTALNVPPGVPSDAERETLYDHVLGREMPYPPLRGSAYSQQTLTFEERQRFRLWIQQGAKVEACGACSPFVAPDGGAPLDAGADAGDGGI